MQGLFSPKEFFLIEDLCSAYNAQGFHRLLDLVTKKWVVAVFPVSNDAHSEGRTDSCKDVVCDRGDVVFHGIKVAQGLLKSKDYFELK